MLFIYKAPLHPFWLALQKNPLRGQAGRKHCPTHRFAHLCNIYCALLRATTEQPWVAVGAEGGIGANWLHSDPDHPTSKLQEFGPVDLTLCASASSSVKWNYYLAHKWTVRSKCVNGCKAFRQHLAHDSIYESVSRLAHNSPSFAFFRSSHEKPTVISFNITTSYATSTPISIFHCVA